MGEWGTLGVFDSLFSEGLEIRSTNEPMGLRQQFMTTQCQKV